MSKLLGEPIQLRNRIKSYLRALLVSALCLCFESMTLRGQSPVGISPTPSPSATAGTKHVADLERRLDEVTVALRETSATLQNYLSELQTLRGELNALKSDSSAPGSTEIDGPAASGSETAVSSADDARGVTNVPHEFTELYDEQVAQQSEIKQLDQAKVEVSSKYPIRVSGLILFNAFSNVGVVDDAELPTTALGRYQGSSHGSNGATLRQTLLSLEAFGPRLAGARTSGQVTVDFFGGSSLNSSGYALPSGSLRMRQAKVAIDWHNSTLSAGYVTPLISPLAPDSFAMVAVPSLAGSGNLWTWSPQASFEQRFSMSDKSTLAVEAGLIYPGSPGYTSSQLVSPIEASRRPGYEGRLSYRTVATASNKPDAFELGIGAYSAQQFYASSYRVHSWAVTGDWRVPVASRFRLSGEIYRGRAIGGLGGGAYKDIVSGVDTTTGRSRTAPVEAVGGWSQLKVDIARDIEGNAIFGLDDALARSFEGLTLDETISPLEAYSRNGSIGGNIIFRPKTYLLISPEYRRLRSWRYTGPPNAANIFTVSAGYQF